MVMVRIDEEGRYTRRLATYKELPERITDLLQRFISARLLAIPGYDKVATVEVSHGHCNLLAILYSSDGEAELHSELILGHNSIFNTWLAS